MGTRQGAFCFWSVGGMVKSIIRNVERDKVAQLKPVYERFLEYQIISEGVHGYLRSCLIKTRLKI